MMLLLAWSLLISLQEDSVGKWVEQLRSESLEVRDQASQRLLALGKTALPELRKAAADPERAPIARPLLWRITVGPTLAAKIKKLDPVFEEAAPWESPATWTRFFLELTGDRDEEEGPQPLRPLDYSFLFPLALAGAKTSEDVDEVLRSAVGYRMYDTAPEMATLLTHADAKIRGLAVTRLRYLGAREFLPQILRRIDDPDPEVRGPAFDAAGAFRATDEAPRLIELLTHSDEDRRRGAALALGRMECRDAIGPLVKRLADPAAGVRAAAGEALIQLRAYDRTAELAAILEGGSREARNAAFEVMSALELEEALPGIRKALKDRRPDRRIWAIDKLSAMRPAGFIQDLVGLMDDPDPGVRHCAIQELTHHDSREPVSRIVKALEDPHSHETAIRYVQTWRPPESIPYFLKQLEVPDRRGEAIQMLGFLKAKEAGPALLQFLLDEDQKIHAAAIGALAAMDFRDAIPEIEKLVDHENLILRSSAVSILVSMNARQSIPALRKRLPKDNGPNGRNEIERHLIGSSLARLGQPEGLEALFDLLDRGSDWSRIAAIKSLSELNPPGTLSVMRRALKDPNPEVVDSAVQALKEARCREAVPDVVLHLATTNPQGAGYWAARMIVDLGAREVIPETIKLLNHESAEVRVRVAEVLGQLGAKEAIPDLRRLVQDPKADVAALSALADLGAMEALPAMRRFLDSDDPRLRVAGVVALGKLGLRETIPDLIRMLRDENNVVVRNAVESLVELGAREAVPEILRLRIRGEEVDLPLLKLGWRGGLADCLARAVTTPEDFTMNAPRRPEVWNRLLGRVYVRHPEDTIREALERIAREAGLRLEWPRLSKEQEQHFSVSQWEFRGSRLSEPRLASEAQGRSSLLRALELTAGTAYFSVVLEADRIRLMDGWAAREFWKAWWKEERRRP